ncbi:Uncharacterised protein [Escherichia coli]|uniref:Uncharacterized protein n=1 Tax=Escherichia coli TaxID=562 RepID=A0A377BLH4_ECOLX|nr:Uncharacterised protein [Escherichia coli]
MTTVRTHVIERAQNLITTAYQHDAFANDLTRHIIIGIRQFAAMSDANPAFGEDVLFFRVQTRSDRYKNGQEWSTPLAG